jgi:hypothetical protein
LPLLAGGVAISTISAASKPGVQDDCIAMAKISQSICRPMRSDSPISLA